MKPAFVPLSAGPVSVAARAWRFRGKTHVTAIVKASFRLAQDRPMEVANPLPITDADVRRSASPAASAQRPSDLALFIRHPEISLDATAFSSGQVEQMNVRLAIARGTSMVLSKELRILGDRTARVHEAPPRPLPFARMPIVYERALGGGATPENPSGVGAVTEAGGRVTMPNVMLGEGARVEPAGFGAISSAWSTRRARLGGLAPDVANAGPFVEIPETFDHSYFQSAPMDQWVESFKAGDMLVFIGLHPELTTLRTSIPNLRGVALVETKRGNKAPVRLKLDSIFVEPHQLKAELTFRGHLEVLAEDIEGMMVAGALEDPAQPFVFPDLKALSQMVQKLGGVEHRPAPAPAAPPGRARDSTLILEAEAPPAARTGAASLRAVFQEQIAAQKKVPQQNAPQPNAPQPNAVISTMVMDADAPPPAVRRPFAAEEPPPRKRDLTMEMSVEEAPRSLPFARRSKRGRSSGSMRAVTESSDKAGTPWAKEAPARAPTANASIHSTLVVDPPEAPPPAVQAPPPVAAPVAAPPPKPAPAPPVEKKKVQWAHIEPSPEAAKPPPPRAALPPAPDRKAELYKKFKR